MDSGKRGERVDQGQRCQPAEIGLNTQRGWKKMQAAGQIFGRNLDGFYQKGPIEGSPYNAPSLFPSLPYTFSHTFGKKKLCLFVQLLRKEVKFIKKGPCFSFELSGKTC